MRVNPIRDTASPSLLIPTAVLLIGAVAVGYLLTVMNPLHSLLVAVFVLLFAVAFIWPEFGLYVVIFSMLLSPEFMAGELTGKATLGRGFTLRFEDFLLVFIGLSWFARGALDKSKGLFRKTPVNKPIAAYIVVCFLATLWGKITGTVQGNAGFFFVLKYFEYILVFFLVVNYVESEDQVKRLLFCLFLTCFIVSIYGLLQIPSGVRVSAPFEGEKGEPNTFGGYLVFMGALAVALLDQLKNLRVRLGLFLLLGVLVVCLVYTQSRASYLAVIPAYLVLSFFSGRRNYLVAGLLIFLVLSPVVLPRVATERIAYTLMQEKDRSQISVAGMRLDSSTSARVISWKEGLSDWRKRPILGNGVCGYGFIDAQYPRILVETGILGVLAFAWLIYALFRSAFDTWKNNEDDLLRSLSVGVMAGLVGLLVHAVGANSFIIVRIMEPFWCVVGVLVALGATKDGRSSPLPLYDFSLGRGRDLAGIPAARQ
jgi:O-antigen ligase